VTPREAARGTDALSAVPPNYLHTMRESFSVLDRENTGNITKSDVASTLAELGLDDSPAAMAAFFPKSGSLNLSSYLNLLAQDLVRLSRQDELAAAFSAFDKDDSGQIDVAELKDALLNTAPEDGRHLSSRDLDQVLDGFVGRRVLKKGQVTSGLGGNKEVFRYNDFITNIWAAGSTGTT
jgi:Ca2+-binding EF-hand superfamily protein